MDSLDSIRKEIDQTDHDIINSIKRRFELTRQVGIIKAEHNTPIVDPDREAIQFAKFKQLAFDYGLDENMICNVYRSILNTVYQEHEQARQSRNS